MDIAGSEAAEGVFATMTQTPETIQGADKWIADYKSKFGAAPGPYSTQAYDAVRVAAEAVKQAGSTDGSAVIKALEGIDGFQLFSGPLKFTPDHTLSSGGFQILAVEKGKIVLKDALCSRPPAARRRPPQERAAGASPPEGSHDPTPLERSLRRIVLRPGRPGLHHGVRHHQAPQLRPRRPVHARCVRRFRRPERRRRLATGLGSVALLIVLIIAMLVTGTAGLLLERIAYRPLRGAPRLSVLITAVGASFALEYGMRLVAGPDPEVYPVRLGGDSINLLGARITIQQASLIRSRSC